MVRCFHLLFLVTLVGCSSESTVAPPAPVTEAAPDPAPTPAALADPVAIAIPMADGTELAGDLALGESGGATVFLFHRIGASRQEWDAVAEGLRRAGHTVVRVDLRGHGESPGGPTGWRSFGPDEWAQVGDDGAAVLEWASLRSDLSPTWVLGGSSIGSSVALRAGTAEEVDGVFALSPGRAYHGVDAMTPIAGYPAERPLLLVAARGEVASAETAREMARVAPSGSARLVDGSGHGVAMLDDQPGLLSVIEDFVSEVAR